MRLFKQEAAILNGYGNDKSRGIQLTGLLVYRDYTGESTDCSHFCDFLFVFSINQPLSDKRSTQKGKNLLPKGANSFLLE